MRREDKNRNQSHVVLQVRKMELMIGMRSAIGEGEESRKKKDHCE